ncbi:four helix bundle protein [Telluribacter sp. SYSU D00476]|uniref:four helix bundle protein n=1 Tax=Telluribacter sp. SYSU D00476 TaxID=2811430 RepID=UPI001FF3C7AF|nr:four helix bundle protein [Telluribacter sp. SYSU D00476]
MAKIEKFEDLVVWQEGFSLATRLYELLSGCKDFGLRDQMQRAAVSIPSNIAEGFERYSNKDFIRFLRIAKGSTGELRTQIQIAIRIGVLSQESGEELINKTRLISSMLHSLIKTRTENFTS